MVSAAWFLGVALTLQVPPPATGPSPASGLRQERRAFRDAEAAKLEALAVRLEAGGQVTAAKYVRSRIEPIPDDDATRFVPRPEIVRRADQGFANVPTRPGTPEPWRSEFQAIRDDSARDLFALAGRAAATASRHLAVADDCLRAVLDRQPNHPEARRLLGYLPLDDGWATPYAAQQLRMGKVDHPTFGWVDQGWVAHLERGELPAPSPSPKRTVQWLPAAQADELRRAWDARWKISTEHFTIQTNVPLSKAIAFGRQLEAFHDLFCSLLADLLATENRLPLAQRFADKAMVGEKRSDPHQVYYFADKAEYIEFLTPSQGPKIAGSLGIYIPPRPGKGKRAPAFFYRDPGGEIEAAATLYHEVSHQLLFELAGPNAYDRNVGNYWVFEGLGTYFETVEPGPDGVLRVGGLVGPRIREAKVRLLEKHEFVPISQLVQLGQRAFNQDEVVHMHYAESMALAVFLMQARDGKYRESFLDYVKDAYRGRLKRETGRSLEDRLDVSYSELEGQLLDYLKPR